MKRPSHEDINTVMIELSVVTLLKMFIKYLILSLALLLVRNSSGEQCTKLSFQKLCVTDGDSVVLENEKLSITINKTIAQMTELYFNSQADPSIKSKNLLKDGFAYYNSSVEVDGITVVGMPVVGSMNITQSDDVIDLAFIHTDTNFWPVNFELHLVLEKNSSIFYYYSLHKYFRDGYTCGELRWALGARSDVFKYFSVDGKRAGPVPSQEDMYGSTSVQDWTYLFKDGSVYTKYQQISPYEMTDSVFGIYGDKIGMSLLQTYKDWVPGGPFKQDLTTHPGYGQMLLYHEHSSHYGTPRLAPTKGWSKLYGPVAFYLNEGNNYTELYKDAQRQLLEEKKRWPYTFVTAPEYNAEGRGSVTGVLNIDGVPNTEWIILTLTEPQVDDPQYESATYMYSTKAEEDGKFTISAVRPGTYKLHVVAKGVVGKYIQSNITVQSKNSTDLGTINWVPESHGELLWQIGVPDRSAAEFASPEGYPSPIPNLEEYRKFGTFLRYPKEFPNDPDFTVGKSDPAKDWCYFMPMIKTPAFFDQFELFNITPNTNPTNWKIRFDYNGTTEGNATLTLGFAAQVRSGIRAVLNGHEILNLTEFEGPEGDSALFRQAAHGIVRQKTVTFDQSLLKDSNVLEFMPPWAVSRNQSDSNLMWDFLRLEVSGAATQYSIVTIIATTLLNFVYLFV